MRPYILLISLLILSLLITMAPYAVAEEKVVVAVDLAHGENDKYLDYIMGNITSVDGRTVEWVIIDESITPDVLENVDILILGQPTTSLTPDEMQAIISWLEEGNKALWVASDSDYGGGPSSQKAANELLEVIGAKLRVEYGAVYDDVYNAKAYYRVLGFVEPDNMPFLYTDIIKEGIEKPVLYHGPSVVIWVDENGVPHDPVTETFEGLVRIVWTSDVAYMADNNPPPTLLYSPLFDKNRSFILLAAEYWADNNNVIVVSGESPYGDYEPTWASVYYGVELDGPKFVTNMIRWLAKIAKEGAAIPTRTVTTTVTKEVTETLTTTRTQTTTETVTETVTETITETETKTVTSTFTTTSVETETATVTVTDWTMTGVVGIILLIIGLVVGMAIKRK